LVGFPVSTEFLMDLDTVVQRGTECVEARMGEQTVMMSIAQGKYFAVEETAQRIWELIGEPTPARDLSAALQAEYDVTADQCEAELLAFLSDLKASGLISEHAG
jgi:hypothetical protein